jgi:uncharacterized protein YqjF (DUF2071 family)
VNRRLKPQAPTLAQRLAVRERPHRPVVLHQTWRDLLFVHWEVEPEIIQATLPSGLYLDTFEGKAYLGIVPFFMCNVHPRFTFNVPGLSNFPETNLRTYVYDEAGNPGVMFYSLDAYQRIAVWIARTFYNLPYHYAQMPIPHHNRNGRTGQPTVHHTQRQSAQPRMWSKFVYAQGDDLTTAVPGTLPFFLLERYLFFTNTPRGLRVGRVWHEPYPFAPAKVSAWDANLLVLAGFDDPQRPPDSLLMSPGVVVDTFALQAVSAHA